MLMSLDNFSSIKNRRSNDSDRVRFIPGYFYNCQSSEQKIKDLEQVEIYSSFDSFWLYHKIHKCPEVAELP